MAVGRASSSASSPQRRHLTFKPCRHLLGCHHLGSRLKQLNRQAIGALALALEICPVIGCRCFEPRDLRLQCLKPCRRLLGRRSFGSRLKQLNRQAIGALAFALEICSVIGCRCFEPRDLRLQCLKPCRRLLGRRSFGSRLKQLNRQAIGALALALEICSVIGCRCFEPRDLRLQCLKPCRRLLGRRSFGSRLKQLNRQAIGALALALKFCFVIGCRCFEPRDFGLQRLNLCR